MMSTVDESSIPLRDDEKSSRQACVLQSLSTGTGHFGHKTLRHQFGGAEVSSHALRARVQSVPTFPRSGAEVS